MLNIKKDFMKKNKYEFKKINELESNCILNKKEIINILTEDVITFNINYPAYIFCKIELYVDIDILGKSITSERNITGTWIGSDISLLLHIQKMYKQISNEYTDVIITSITLRYLFNKKFKI